jgi:hypothetical protein
VHFGGQRQKFFGEKFKEGYFSHFLAKPGVESVHIGVLDILEPLEPSILHYENYKELF